MKQFEPLFSLPGDLTDAWRQKMWQRSELLKPPLPKGPGFDYVPLAKYYAKNYQLPDSTPPLNLTSFILPECVDSYLVYVDGFFRPEMSCIPSSIIALPLAKAMKSYGLFIQYRLQKTLKEETDFFALVNGACHGQSLFLYLPPETKLATPLQILHLSASKQTLAIPRTHCVMGKGAHLQILQTASPNDSSAVFDCVLDEMSHLSFYDTSTPSCAAWQMQTFRALLKKDSFLQAFFLTTGAETVRNSFAIELAEEGSEALIKGLSLLSNKAESHFYGKMEHKAAHCKSRQQIKSILSGSSRSSFEGKIFVHPSAQ
ncbi:MAG: SufD family Fe-S cluster assembly protein, partial [Chlamydiales bacterium]|nr:SufD family Fe-S cluster assembly protein [Chlamydiales bacterium]